MRHISFLYAAVVAGASLFAQPVYAAQPAQKMQLGGGSFVTYIAQTKGLFAEFGLEVEIPRLPTSGDIRGALANGKIQIAEFGVDNALSMAEKGEADVIVIMAGDSVPSDLVLQKGLRSLSELRGKILLVDAPNTQNAVIMKRLLARQGLETPRDYQMKEVGGTAARVAELRKEPSFGGTMASWPLTFQMQADGFPVMGSSVDVAGPMLLYVTFVKRDWALANRETVKRYLSANIKSLRWITASANKKEVTELLAKYRGLSPEVGVLAYDAYMGPNGWVRDGILDEARLANVIKLRAEVEGGWGGKPPPAQQFYDASYLRDALAAIGP